MRRRDFITLLGGAAAAWPRVARAQQASMPVVGFLRVTSAADATNLVTAFRQGLKRGGFRRGAECRRRVSLGGRSHRSASRAGGDLIRRQVAVIVGHGQAAQIAKAATTTTPIIFVVGDDPVRIGLVANLNRPGGNVTGVTFIATDVTAKRLGLLHELVSQAAVIAVLLDPNLPDADLELRSVEAASRTIGVRVLVVKAATAPELIPPSQRSSRPASARCLSAAARSSPPSVNGWRCCPRAMPFRPAIRSASLSLAGGLMSYGPSQADAYRRAGSYAARILKGERPGDVPVDQPTKFELVINLGTAATLGLHDPHRVAIARRRGDRISGDVRYWHLADIPSCTAHVRYSGVKRTWRFAPHMSAFDPKRTSQHCDPLRQPA